MRKFNLPELEDEEKNQFETSPLMDELTRQQAPVTEVPDIPEQEIEREVSAANEIANESIELGNKYAQEEPVPSNEMQKKADELAYKKDVYSKFTQATPKEQNEIQDDLKALQEEAGKKSSNLNWFRLGDKIAQAYGQRHGGKVAGFQDIYDSLEKQAQQPVLDYKNLQKNELDKLSQLMESYKSKSLSEKTDPSSPYARVQKSLLDSAAKKGGFDLGNTEGLSAEALNELNRLVNYYNTNKENIAARKEQSKILSQQRGDALTLKANEKEEKKKATMFEIEDRRQNINEAISTLDEMIKEDGTYEVFGSQNQDIDRLIDQIATDMAKLADPVSVARPSEVESVKKNLIESGFKNTNSTARQLLQNFKGEVDRRADFAYRIRGIEKPQGEKAAASPQNSTSSQNKNSSTNNLDSKIESFMKKNGIKDKNEAIEILKKEGII